MTKLWNDEEIGGRIYIQLCNLFPDPLLADQKEKFFSHAFSVMHKLTATKYHLDNYERTEKNQYEDARRKFKKNPNQTREAFELIFELEAFLFQIKSSLDMLIKLLIPIVGEGIVRTTTYSNEGDDLIKGLNQYKKKTGVHIPMIDQLITLAETNKHGWLKATVDMRDELNHRQGLRDYKFLPVKLPSGEIIAKKPKFKDFNTLDMMKTIHSNNLIFQQDFMSIALAIKAGPAFILMQENPARVQGIFNHKSAKYVRWCWGLNLPQDAASQQNNNE